MSISQAKLLKGHVSFSMFIGCVICLCGPFTICSAEQPGAEPVTTPFERAYDHYRKQKFDVAQEELDKILAKGGNGDGVSSCLGRETVARDLGRAPFVPRWPIVSARGDPRADEHFG